MSVVIHLAKYRSEEQRQVVAQRGYSRFLIRQREKAVAQKDKPRKESR